MMKRREINKLVNEVETYCKKNGLRFTPPRRIALEVIAASRRPIGAYDMVEEMGGNMDKPKPTTVYRAIEFLQQHSFIHKIESVNGFVVCRAEHQHEGSQFIICNDCGAVEEVYFNRLSKKLQEKIDDSGFKMTQWNTEIHGTCRQCQVWKKHGK